MLCFAAFFVAGFIGVGWGVIHMYQLLGYWKNRLFDGGTEREVRIGKVRKARFAFLVLWASAAVIGGLGVWLGGWPIEQR